MFRTVPLYIIRSFSTVHTAMVYVIRVLLTACEQDQYGTPVDVPKNCPKHVEFYSKNKFEKLVHLFGFNLRIYHYALSSERQNRSLFLR